MRVHEQVKSVWRIHVLILALPGHDSTIQSVAGSDDGESEFLQDFLAVVFICRVAGWFVHAGNLLQRLSHNCSGCGFMPETIQGHVRSATLKNLSFSCWVKAAWNADLL